MKSLLFLLIFNNFLAIQHANANPANPLFRGISEGHPACFSKVYTNAHLRSHPKQSVQAIKAKLEVIDEYNQGNLNLEIVLKSDPNKIFTAIFSCIGEKTCVIDCDGGSVELVRGPHRGIQIRNNGIAISSGCGDEIEALEVIFLDAENGGDDIFNLSPIADSSLCK